MSPAGAAEADPSRLVDWFSRPAPGRPGLLNLSYNALDRHVIRGLADEPALLYPFAPAGLRSHYSYAELLELVGQLSGGLRQLGVRPGLAVAIDLPVGPELVIGLLACARLGAVATPLPVGPGTPPLVAILVAGSRKAAAAAELAAADARPTFAVVVRPEPGTLDQRGDVDYDALMKPGQYEPGVCAELPADAPLLRAAQVTRDHSWTLDLAAAASERALAPGTFVDPAADEDLYAGLLTPLIAGATVELR